MEKVYRLGMVEEIINEMDLHNVPADIIESWQGCQIVISGWRVNIPELGVNLHQGVLCSYDGEAEACLPDYAITVVTKPAGEVVAEGEWIYYEQNGFMLTLLNYLHGEMDINRIEQLPCFIQMPDAV